MYEYTLADAGGATVFDLPIGVYHLVETEPPTGYTLKANAVVVYVNDSSVTYDEHTSVSYGGSGVVFDPDTNTYTLTVTNTAGFVLPSTGGPGTAALSLVGSVTVLLAGAGLFLLNRKKRTG